MTKKIGIIGAGNIGGAIARGFLNHSNISAGDITLSRKKKEYIRIWKETQKRVS